MQLIGSDSSKQLVFKRSKVTPVIVRRQSKNYLKSSSLQKAETTENTQNADLEQTAGTNKHKKKLTTVLAPKPLELHVN